MPNKEKVLVVATTADYIDWIRRSCPDEGLFLTDPQVRRQANEPAPAPAEELTCTLTCPDLVGRALVRHLDQYRLALVGIACFDCESMPLAARLAERFGLCYPSTTAITNCRDKYRTKALWRAAGLITPHAYLPGSEGEAARFFELQKGPVVLKPLNGSGSELVFACNSSLACRSAYRFIQDGLRRRRTQRLYGGDSSQSSILLETRVAGVEYSCDFWVSGGRIGVIRVTRKIPAPGAPFGTIRAYVLTDGSPAGIDPQRFRHTLLHCVTALGVDQALCMLDFMVCEGCLVLLELAPRPGGDCLPYLLRRGLGLDILKLQLDFARHRKVAPLPAPPPAMVGVRIHARKNGRLLHVAPPEDHRIVEFHLGRGPGHQVRLPPQDYDSWLLGHYLFVPDEVASIEDQCTVLLARTRIRMASARLDPDRSMGMYPPAAADGCDLEEMRS